MKKDFKIEEEKYFYNYQRNGKRYMTPNISLAAKRQDVGHVEVLELINGVEKSKGIIEIH